MRNTTIRTTVARNCARLMRVISNAVPSKKIAGGKKSVIDGGWNSSSVDVAVAISVAA
tara:strand:+ start:629 stop:802 length:174 start_codon:yes stop_codon:yes gene_type:complete